MSRPRRARLDRPPGVPSLLLAAALPLACLATASPGGASPGGAGRTAEPPALAAEAAASAAGERLRERLEAALEGPGGRDDLVLSVASFAGGEHVRAEVFGDGVGIWGGARLFRSSAAELEAAIRAALDAGFPEMAPSYGGEATRRRIGGAPEGGGPVRLVRALEIEAGDVAKRVEQIAGGEPYRPLLELTDRLLGQWRAAGEAGTTAADLDQGLADIAAGRLAPQALRLTLHDKPELGSPGTGVLLRLRGRRGSARPFDSDTGYGPPRPFELGVEEHRALAGRLAALAPGGLPGNLYASGYLDLTLDVLGHRRAIQARRFAGMTAATHGSLQRDFDRLVEALRRIVPPAP